jgi:single-stranded-DNA-specific exonuclease
MDTNYADNYLDLVAVGVIADVMDAREIENKYLIDQGLAHIKNPFLEAMIDKNAYSLGTELTPIGIAFYIVPYINAVCRSGTQEEKTVVFESLLNHKAYEKILSTKRGHKINEKEMRVVQATRVATNAKARQTKTQDAAIEDMEKLIERDNLLLHKVLLIILSDNDKVPSEIRGLCANKLMSKYNRPCCILAPRGESYQGSARGCTKVGIPDFKKICEDTACVDYAQGHSNAFGLSIPQERLREFINLTDKALADVNSESIYLVDYIYKDTYVDANQILDIANMKDLWGTNIDEALIAIENLKVTKNKITLLSRDKKPTLKITLPCGVSLIKFGSSVEEYESLLSEGYVQINVVGTANRNEWNGNVTPQILIKEYEITEKASYYF